MGMRSGGGGLEGRDSRIPFCSSCSCWLGIVRVSTVSSRSRQNAPVIVTSLKLTGENRRDGRPAGSDAAAGLPAFRARRRRSFHQMPPVGLPAARLLAPHSRITSVHGCAARRGSFRRSTRAPREDRHRRARAGEITGRSCSDIVAPPSISTSPRRSRTRRRNISGAARRRARRE